MNRIEYMTKLASLLQDIPEVERKDAMKYYNDYFDEAGEENEEQVIREFGAPEEVAENIKADLKGKTENTTHGQQEEYQSAGQQYQMNHQENKQSSEYQYGTSDDQKKKNARIGKIVLIVALAIIIGPVLIPIIGGILAAGLAMVLTIIVGVFALVIGISLVISGSVILLPQTAAGLALIGSGLIIMVLGVVATVGFGKLCEVVLRGLAKGMKYLWEKISHRKVVA